MAVELPQLTDQDEIAGKTVLVRGALNVPVEDGEITNDFRLRNLLPTISWLTTRDARVILVGHMSGNNTDSFSVVADYLKKHASLTFIEDYANGAAKEEVQNMQNGDIVLFENLRHHSGEKANSTEFAKQLADYADAYVNDAFPAAHREHASIVGVPKLLPSFAGLQFVREVENLSQALDPTRPFVFILGGAKFSTKLPLAEKFTSIADDVFVGGAIANAYMKTAGNTVGDSSIPDKSFSLQKGLKSSTLHVPVDFVCQTEKGTVETKSVSAIEETDTIVDIGHRTLDQITESVEGASMVVWNGPLGWYEKGFSETTDQLANTLSSSEAQTILGGGDTAAVVLDDMSDEDFSFVSTAGGAMVQFLADETLPGIQVLV